MSKVYDDEFKKRIVRLYLNDGRTMKSIISEYGVSKSAISSWVSSFRNECQDNISAKEDYDYMIENKKLRQQITEQEREILFLKKAAAFFAKEIG